jgi:hypothetical protein
MKYKIFLVANIILSLLFLGSVVVPKIVSILNVENSYLYITVVSCPFIFTLLFANLFLLFKQKTFSRIKYIPLLINIITIIAGVGLLRFDRVYPDLGFIRSFKDYETVTKLVESGQIRATSNGFAELPPKLAHTSTTSHVYVSKEAGVTTIYFLDDFDEIDDYSWGYLYRSDGSEPPKPDQQHGDRCRSWRAIKPPIAKWFYCIGSEVNHFPWPQS